MAGIKDSLRKLFLDSTIGAIIGVNVLVFLVVKVAALFCAFDARWVAMSSDLHTVMMHPWTIFTYQVCQWNFLHLLFNMLWLWGFGSILARSVSAAQILRLYIMGGVVGALAFLIVSWGSPGLLVGSSASICAIIAAVTFYMPRVRVNVMLFGEVEMRWIGLVALLLILIGSSWPAHVGGAAFGAAYGIVKLSYGIDITRLGIQKRACKVAPKDEYIHRGLTLDEQQELDALLAKVKKHGYGGLNSREKTRLFDVSKKIR